ncbi:enoyl-CoA hydratase/isomerase family protein [Nocardia sp. NBC_00565]|uniref:enoyl-CoA hydratase/isomerase family protein n=1 Tax=Nocardia sp. NBC_00565 TaxID=2975993 RepID=UPI002E8106F8|nr:enoyl-CoA hydratase/isomerase family protein [Nocardia sp. NBC_00565]WUC01914.1 enoyl-CoA hydratase/isomerase family protein [Nocardia sp. NBC_00565]
MEFDDELRYEKDGPIRRIILNRPTKHNALNVSMQKQLHEAIRAVRFDEEARVLIIRGAGDTFCAGDDIAEMPILNTRKLSFDSATTLAEPSSDPEWSTYLIVSMFQETAALLENLTDVVTIAAVDGVCMGGGLELTLCCDFVLTTPNARWGMPEIDMGITPGWGGCTRLQRFAGRRRTKEINLLGYEFSGRQALEWDLANRVVEREELDTEVNRLAELMLQKSKYAIRRSKHVLNRAADGPMGQVAAFELPIDPAAGPMDAHGIGSFAEKGQDLATLRNQSRTFWADQRR